VHPESLIDDRPIRYGSYAPENFDMTYQGTVTVRKALQLSLNVPAIALLERVGPHRLTARFKQAGGDLVLPKDETPGLAMGLGGVGVTLSDLVQLYAGFPRLGSTMPLRERLDDPRDETAQRRLMDATAAWHIGNVLMGTPPPENGVHNRIAFKTGTSYGYRDAWSIGFDGRHVLGVWVGRPDASAVAGLAGYVSAAPILFEGFTRSGLAAVPLARAPAGTFRPRHEDLPVTLVRFAPGEDGLSASPASPTEPAPQIVFPQQGAHIDLTGQGGSPLVLKLQGGRPPFRWLANGKPLAEIQRKRIANWLPDGTGYSTLTVVDAAGRAASVKVFVE
jgi:penicillin-binding protein 1C